MFFFFSNCISNSIMQQECLLQFMKLASDTLVFWQSHQSLKLAERGFLVAYKKQVYISCFPKNLVQEFILCCKVFMCVTLTVLSFPVSQKQKKVKWNDLISQQTDDKSTPSSAEGPQGLGERCCTARFSTTTWQVPGSMGFVRSKCETKHHLWNGILIDCCSHYQVEVLKLFRVYGKKC